MPPTTHQKPPTDPDRQLSQLLRLKRLERPNEDFWNRFDEELRSKQLAALVGSPSWRERFARFSLLFARKSSAALAVASVFALAILALSKSQFSTSAQSPEQESSLAAKEALGPSLAQAEGPVFVVEASEGETETQHEIAAAIPNIDAQPFYVINTMTKETAPASYQVIAAPKQLTIGRSPSESDLGAQVIRTRNHF